jgi:uncharacterized caspase-like protein
MKRVLAISAVLGITVVLATGCFSLSPSQKRDIDSPSSRVSETLVLPVAEPSLSSELPTFLVPDGTRYALVIGNGDYKNTILLANPSKDAKDVAKALENVGFTVTLQTDASLSQMESAIREFSSAAKRASAQTVLFFYAGHGVQFEGVNYLLPIDADIQKDYELRSKAVSMDLVSDSLDDTDSDFNLILLDACRDNPFATSRGGDRGLTAMGGRNSESMVVFSTSPGSVAQDGEGINSPFVTALKQNLYTPDLEVRQLVAAVSKGVQKLTKGQQVPWVNTSFTGSFYFVTAEQQVQSSRASSSRLQQEIESLEKEIAERQKAMANTTDVETLSYLSEAQQKAMIAEATKRFETLQVDQIRSQAEAALAVQQREQIAKQDLQTQVWQQSESLAKEAQLKREELERLELEQRKASGPLAKLEMIGDLEQSKKELEKSFDLTIEIATNEMTAKKDQLIAAYLATNLKNPWESEKEYDTRVAVYQNSLEIEGSTAIKALESQKKSELQKLDLLLDAAKKDLKATTYSVAAKVEVQPFDAENKQFPLLLFGEGLGIPFKYRLFYTLNSADAYLLQREYEKVMQASLSEALVGELGYEITELQPSQWVARPISWQVSNLLGENKGKIEVLKVSSASSIPELLQEQKREGEIFWSWGDGNRLERTYSIGDIGPAGGYIFYDKGFFSEGWQYLEAAPERLEWQDRVWGGYGLSVGGTGFALGTGKGNTEKIVAAYGKVEPFEKRVDYAAKLCADLVTAGFSDWFLPSRDELNQMFLNLSAKGIEGFSDDNYWSSSQSTGSYAWSQPFSNGYPYNDDKDAEYTVRAVRSF